MIIDPDFLDHWRTRMLVDALGGDEFAPLYLLRLWGHCQSRKSVVFEMPSEGLKALCRCQTVEATLLESAMEAAGYIERKDGVIRVLKWAEQNAALIAAWVNGATGGRPKKPDKPAETKPNQNPWVSEPEPMANPDETHGEPNHNPSLTQTKPIRVDKRREDKKGKEETKNLGAKALEILTGAGVGEQVARDWLQHRKTKKASASQTVIAARAKQAAIAGISLEDALAMEVSRGWQGFEAAWVQGKGGGGYQTATEKAKDWADRLTGKKRNESNIIDITPPDSFFLG